MFTLSICPKPTTPPLTFPLCPPSLSPSLPPSLPAVRPFSRPLARSHLRVLSLLLAHSAVGWVWQCQTCELPQVCLLYTECLKRGRVMLDGQDACNYKNFFWTEDALGTLLAATNVSISDLGCRRDDFFKHRGASQRFQTVKSAPAQASTTTEATTVNFQVSVVTNVGERVVAVGSCTPLGMWEPRNGLELHITNAVLPLWQAQILKSQYVVTFYCQCLCGSRT